MKENIQAAYLTITLTQRTFNIEKGVPTTAVNTLLSASQAPGKYGYLPLTATSSADGTSYHGGLYSRLIPHKPWGGGSQEDQGTHNKS